MQVTMLRNAKTLSPSHVKQCILSESRFDFLRDLVKNIPDVTAAEEREMISRENSPNSTRFPETSAPRRIVREDSNSSSSSDVRVQQIISAPKENLRRTISLDPDMKTKIETITSQAIDLTKKPDDKPIVTANFYQETLVTDDAQHQSVITVNPTYASPQPSTSSYGSLTTVEPARNVELTMPKKEQPTVFYLDIRQPNNPPKTPITPIINIDFTKNLGKPEIKVLDTSVASIVGVPKVEKKIQRQNSKQHKAEVKKIDAKPIIPPRIDIDHLNSGNLQIDEDYDT